VDDAFGVSGIECVGDLGRQRQQCFGLERLARDAVLKMRPSRYCMTMKAWPFSSSIA
jgi:hypothetical protein